jgi:hypothetical protein
MPRRLALLLLALMLMSCQILSPRPVPTERTAAPETARPPATAAAPTTAAGTSTPAPSATAAGPAPEIATPTLSDLPANENPLALEITRPIGFGDLTAWQPQRYTVEIDVLPVDLEAVSNPAVIAGLTAEQRRFLEKNGFVVMPTHEEQFSEIRERVAEFNGQPYYLTTDAAYHALHVTFDETLKALERDFLRAQMAGLVQALLAQVQTYPSKGSPIQADTELAAAYLGVALRLFDPQAALPAGLEAIIQPQVEQILAGAGREKSRLIPNFEDDYGAYKPVGHYAGNPALENYFRGMTWLGRVPFKFTHPLDPEYRPSRAPLIITLALKEASLGSGAPAAEVWKNASELLNFIVGPSDDPGPVEVMALAMTIYGPEFSFTDLEGDAKWQAFLQQIERLPAPQINSTFVNTTAQLDATRDWRLMGQRFTFDASIFQNLISDKVGTPQNPRKIPSGLDVMAVFGSQAAQGQLKDAGVYNYTNYPEQLRRLQLAAADQPEAQWLSRFYTGWLYSFFPQVMPKEGEAYAMHMRTPAWAYKELNTALGSWAELKHDTVLYAKMPEFMGGGGPPRSGPAPAYVEANPQVFYRLGYIASQLGTGLSIRVSADLEGSPGQTALGIDRLMAHMETLGGQFQRLGDIAAKELAGQALDEADLETIQGCLGVVECIPDAYPEPMPVPLVAAVSGAEDVVLEAGVGSLDRIFVAVPINGQMQVAQGGVFSYYEFTQPRAERLTDEEWQQKLASAPPPRPDWAKNFLVPGGEARDVLAFRVGDWYIITAEGGTPPLNLRAGPSKSAEVIEKLAQGMYLLIIDGPRLQGDARWWKVSVDGAGSEGWVLEDPAWYVRAHGQ